MRLLLTYLTLIILFSCGQHTDKKIGMLLDSAQTNIGNEVKMITYLDSADKLGATSKDYYTLRGLSVQKTNTKLSVEYFNKLLEIYPSDTVGYVYRAQSYMMLNQWDKAEKDFTTAIDKNFSYEGGLGECYFNRAIIREELQKRNGAKEDLKKAIEINPKDAMAYCKLGEIAANENDFDKACKFWKKSTELGFDYPEKYLEEYCE